MRHLCSARQTPLFYAPPGGPLCKIISPLAFNFALEEGVSSFEALIYTFALEVTNCLPRDAYLIFIHEEADSLPQDAHYIFVLEEMIPFLRSVNIYVCPWGTWLPSLGNSSHPSSLRSWFPPPSTFDLEEFIPSLTCLRPRELIPSSRCLLRSWFFLQAVLPLEVPIPSSRHFHPWEVDSLFKGSFALES